MKLKKIFLFAVVIPVSLAVHADTTPLSSSQLLQQADQNSANAGTSPIRRIERNQTQQQRKKQTRYRTIDGSFNNLENPRVNVAGAPLARLTRAAYADGIEALAGIKRPGPREISNIVLAQKKSVLTRKRATDFLWQWGQFLDHDIDLTDGVDPSEPAVISIPAGDIHFDPKNRGNVQLDFNRSIYDKKTGAKHNVPRQQLNEISGWIDASNVYGSDDERAAALRRLNGSGKLKTSAKRLLPFNTEGLSNAGGTDAALFLAGDVRANEQAGLTAMHTLFVREHNRLAKKIAAANPNLTGEEIYQQARHKVAAQMQVITYNEFLPVLLGRNALSPYTEYRPKIDASITNEFSTAAYRLGHSLLSSKILRLNKKGKEIKAGHLELRKAFFAPNRITDEGGIEPILRGLASQECQRLDVLIIDDVRNFLFGEPTAKGFDLASLNIQRGRDHGLPSYNAVRKALRLTPAVSFEDVSSKRKIQRKLAAAYLNVNDIDLWVGGLAEDPVKGALVGEVFFRILKDQFERLRDGDRFWYENFYQGKELDTLRRTTLAKVIRRNTKIGDEIQKKVFVLRN